MAFSSFENLLHPYAINALWMAISSQIFSRVLFGLTR
jgi:hypothetical protein